MDRLTRVSILCAGLGNSPSPPGGEGAASLSLAVDLLVAGLLTRDLSTSSCSVPDPPRAQTADEEEFHAARRWAPPTVPGVRPSASGGAIRASTLPDSYRASRTALLLRHLPTSARCRAIFIYPGGSRCVRPVAPSPPSQSHACANSVPTSAPKRPDKAEFLPLYVAGSVHAVPSDQ
jgi:hypothetical protein